MMNTLPQGSNLQIEIENACQKIIIPQKSGGIMRIFLSLFLTFWLCGWAFGWISTATVLLTEKGPQNYFLFFWLCGWTVGGVFAGFFLYRLIRPSIPETILLGNPSIQHDSGVAPLQFSFGFKSQLDAWKQMFKKRKKTEFTSEEIKTLKLREYGEGNRLTIDKGNERIELANGATELEREWLFETLPSQYP